AYVRREHAVAHHASRNDAAGGNNGAHGSAGASCLGEHKLGRRVLALVSAYGPVFVVQVEHRRHGNDVHVRFVVGLQRAYIAPVERFLLVLIDEVERVHTVIVHHSGDDVVVEMMTLRYVVWIVSLHLESSW